MKTHQYKVILRALLGSCLLLFLLTVSLGKSVSANGANDDDSLTLYYIIDRSALPDLSHKELTLKVYAGDATNAAVSTISGMPISHTMESDYLFFTTAANQVQVVLEGVSDPNSVGDVTKTALKDNKKWAWSLGLDDNTSLKASIDVLQAKGWAGTLFMIASAIDDIREEGWIVDALYLNQKLAQGWAVGNHTWGHQCSGQFDYHQTILDGYNRLQQVIQYSANPTYKIISFAAPCFNANYHPEILSMRDNGQTAVQFNESGNDDLLIVDAEQTSDFVTEERSAVAFDLDMPIGRDPRIAYNTPDVIAKIDWMAANASDEHHFWHNNLAHGHAEDTIEEVVDYLYETYGPAGTDEVWVAPSDMIYSYLLVRDNSIVTLTDTLPAYINTPPLIINPGEQASNEEAMILLPLAASDSDDDGLLFSATGLPSALTIEPSTGLIWGWLPSGSAGSYSVTVSVTDDFGDSDSESFTWTVNQVTNQPPSITNLGNQANLTGNHVSLSIIANDPEGDSLTYSATDLPTGLAINSTTGLIAGTIAEDANANSPYETTLIVTDSSSNSNSVSLTWIVNAIPTGGGTGQILQERWDGIFGKTIDQLTTAPDYPNHPDFEYYLSTFETPANIGSAYGTRVRGYIHAPITGEYRFWIAADNTGELWLSSDDSAANMSLIASVPDWTDPQEWDKYPSQESVVITLEAGERYYIEALHKEEWNNDHLAVAWQIPGGSQQLIAGEYLSIPDVTPATNQPPTISNPGDQSHFTADQISLAIVANDPEGDSLTYSATDLPTGLAINSSTGVIAGTIAEEANVNTPYQTTIIVTDSDSNSNSVSLTWSVNAIPTGEGTGQILQERWNGIFGKTIDRLTSDPNYPNNPNSENYLTHFEITQDADHTYGTRVRGYIHAPVTGEYRFWIAADDTGELWLSSDDSPANMSLIASVPDWTNPQEWDKYPSQESVLITLEAGEGYYIEALHKQEWNNHHLAVAWQIPGGTQQLIAGEYLSIPDVTPATNQPPAISNPGDQSHFVGDDVSLAIVANDPEGDSLTYSATDLPTGLAINSTTGVISGTIPEDANPNTAYQTTIIVTDSDSNSNGVSFTWTINAIPTGEGTGQILQERWNGIFGKTIDTLTTAPNYPNNPNSENYLTRFEITQDADHTYGTRVRGYIHAPVTGEYRFWIAADDTGELWLSSDDSPANMSLIASVPDWTNPQEWDKYPSQESVLITLQAGERYYIEALHKQEWNNHHLAVAWQIPGGTQQLIAGEYLSIPDVTPVTNQPPAITNPGDQTNFIGDEISLAIVANDPEGDSLTYSATDLPTGLAINSTSGVISGTIPEDANPNTAYETTIIVTDSYTNSNSNSVSFTWTINAIPTGEGTGQILQERWNGIFGKTIDRLTSDPDYPNNPNSENYLTRFEITQDADHTYGTRVRGYIHAPVTGEYRFWIAADDTGELWLSSDDSPANMSLIASVVDWTDPQEWDKYESQESVLITLQAGERYYIEALHKQEWNNHHLAVAWQIPGGTQQLIAGEYLSIPDVTPATNQPPAISNPGDQTNFVGNEISLAIVANDPEGDSLTYSATDLPTGLAINSTTGVISGTIAEDANANSPYETIIMATDSYTNSNSNSVSFTWTVNAIPTGEGKGQILHERWDGVFGKTIDRLTSDPNYPNHPDFENYLVRFEIPQGVGDVYGTRVRGYIHPLITGQYRFWIAADDAGELWLSTDESPANVNLIASVPEWTDPQEWDKYESQESVLIDLEAGKRYYIEALHKEEWNNDHLAVAWEIPRGFREIIDGEYLSLPDPVPATNQPPAVSNPGDQTNFVGDDVSLAIIANDPEGDSLTYSAIGLPSSLAINSTTGQITGTVAEDANTNSPYIISVTVTDSLTNSNHITFTWSINALPIGNEVGYILRERWDGIFGQTVDRLTSTPAYPDSPDMQDYLTSFEVPQNTGDIYGTRVHGYIYAPVTGEYRFWLASDNGGELWLSSDDDANNKSLIASVPDWTSVREWDKYDSQESILITLQAGERYYIEALHKAEWGADHLAVAWEIPGSTQEVIAGIYLSPYEVSANRSSISIPHNQATPQAATHQIYLPIMHSSQ